MHWKVHFGWIETNGNAESGSGRGHTNSTARCTTCSVTSMDFGGAEDSTVFRSRKKSKKLSSIRAKTQTVQFCDTHAQVASYTRFFLLLLPSLCHISLHTRLHKNVRFAKNWKSPACCVCVQLWRPERPKLKWRMTSKPEGWGWCWGLHDVGESCVKGPICILNAARWLCKAFSKQFRVCFGLCENFPIFNPATRSERKIPTQIAIFQHMSMQGSHRQLQSRSCVHN